MRGNPEYLYKYGGGANIWVGQLRGTRSWTTNMWATTTHFSVGRSPEERRTEEHTKVCSRGNCRGTAEEWGCGTSFRRGTNRGQPPWTRGKISAKRLDWPRCEPNYHQSANQKRKIIKKIRSRVRIGLKYKHKFKKLNRKYAKKFKKRSQCYKKYSQWY